MIYTKLCTCTFKVLFACRSGDLVSFVMEPNSDTLAKGRRIFFAAGSCGTGMHIYVHQVHMHNHDNPLLWRWSLEHSEYHNLCGVYERYCYPEVVRSNKNQLYTQAHNTETYGLLILVPQCRKIFSNWYTGRECPETEVIALFVGVKQRTFWHPGLISATAISLRLIV